MKQRSIVLGVLSFAFAGCMASGTVATGPAQPMPPPPPPPGPTVVVQPAQHPAYLHALTDLRSARAYLARPAGLAVKWDENVAIREIDAAINEIRQAAIDDGKPLEDHPPVDVGMVWGDRLHRAGELVAKARADVNEREDNGFANGLKNRAIQHMNEAERFIREGAEDAARMGHGPVVVVQPAQPPPVVVVQGPGNAHPAYLHALSDLRAARAWLAKPARPDVKFDENRAIREVDAAIKEIREAAIDDGKPLEEHPPLDVNLGHRDRLVKAREILNQSAHDIESREDDSFARGLRARALGHIRNAEKDVNAAIEDRRNR